ncbi:MAG TPA: hypothetical protein VK178_07135 [Opitutaceae bacterium]|nr:hypothetical protein [Opitutaceae bacterium]
MLVRDRMVRGGVVSSQRLAGLSWFQQIVFRDLLHVADDAGRFEANPTLLRAALFGANLHKVSERDVQGALVACHQAGLVKLYTVEGRGYGEVLRFGQEGLRTRRVMYPGPEPQPEDALPGFAAPPASPPEVIHNPPPSPDFSRPVRKERRKETSPQPPAAAGGDVAKAIEARKAGRQYRSQERASDELRAVETELTDILHPGGSAWKVTPTGEKLARYTALMARRAELLRICNSPENTGEERRNVA